MNAKHAVIALVALTLVFGGGWLLWHGEDTGNIKIGFIGPLTGAGAPYGEPARGALQIAVDEINANGGVSGRNIEVIYEDGKCSNKDAVNAAQKLINVDKVKVIIGGLCSGETLAIAPITEAARVILFSPGSSAPSITHAGDYVFRNHVSDIYGGEFLATTVVEKHSRPAIFSESTDYSQGLRGSFSQSLKNLGKAAVSDESFESATKDFRTMLAKAKAANPDSLVLIAQTAGNAAAIAKQARELGLAQQLYSAYLAGPEYLAAGRAVEGTIMIDDVSLTNVKGRELLRKYAGRFGSEPAYSIYAGGSYDALYILAGAIEKVGENSSEIRDYLYRFPSYDGVVGNYHFDQNGDVVGLALTVKKVENGEFVKVNP